MPSKNILKVKSESCCAQYLAPEVEQMCNTPIQSGVGETYSTNANLTCADPLYRKKLLPHMLNIVRVIMTGMKILLHLVGKVVLHLGGEGVESSRVNEGSSGAGGFGRDWKVIIILF